MKKPFITITIAGAGLLALSACELRRDGEVAPDPQPSETPDTGDTGDIADTGSDIGPDTIMASETPAPTATETPAASIIREDVRPDEPEAPVEPLAVRVPFTDGGNDISPEAERALLGILQSDALGEGWPVILRGHTDSSGNDSANLRASRSRAEAVAAWLVERGVDDERISVIAFGEQNPIAPNAKPDGSPDEAGRARNRRVDIEIAPASTRPAGSVTQSNDGA